jgi:predicted GNAT superfamily acetyltransferase
VVGAGSAVGGVVVGAFGAGGTVLAMVVAVFFGGRGGLTVDWLSPEHAATSRPAAKRATSRWTRR